MKYIYIGSVIAAILVSRWIEEKAIAEIKELISTEPERTGRWQKVRTISTVKSTILYALMVSMPVVNVIIALAEVFCYRLIVDAIIKMYDESYGK